VVGAPFFFCVPRDNSTCGRSAVHGSHGGPPGGPHIPAGGLVARIVCVPFLAVDNRSLIRYKTVHDYRTEDPSSKRRMSHLRPGEGRRLDGRDDVTGVNGLVVSSLEPKRRARMQDTWSRPAPTSRIMPLGFATRIHIHTGACVPRAKAKSHSLPNGLTSHIGRRLGPRREVTQDAEMPFRTVSICNTGSPGDMRPAGDVPGARKP
jgi:hypothetical protein